MAHLGECASDFEEEFAGFEYFRIIWETHCKWLRIAKSGTDCCDVCTAYLREPRKDDAAMEKQKTHRERAAQEQEYYIRLMKLCKSSSDSMHIIFDFAQAASLPHQADQPGSMYFKSGFKMRMFGISNEPAEETTVYCIPEGCYPIVGPKGSPKGSNNVIEMLNHHLKTKCPSEIRHLYMHADNCGGQNKNRFVMSYLSYLVACGRFDTITLAFMLTGHTKCSVDGSFGCLKMHLHSTQRVETIPKFIDVVNQSSRSIVAEDTEGFAWRDWKSFFRQFKIRQIPDLMKQHVFQFTKEDPLMDGTDDLSMLGICCSEQKQIDRFDRSLSHDLRLLPDPLCPVCGKKEKNMQRRL
jgi:hypothetical protein